MRTKQLLYKNLSTSTVGVVADVDTATRRVKAYASSFGNIDSHGDMISKGAFQKSISERGANSTSNRKIAHLLQHQRTSPIGRIVEIQEDEKGLLFVSELSKSTKGNDTLIQYEEGILREHSIGFNIVKEEFVSKEKAVDFGYNSEFYNIKEVNLWEVSTVTFGADENTPVVSVGKSIEDQSMSIVKDMDRMQQLLRKGNISDEGCYMLEYQIEQLKSRLNSLLKSDEPRRSTQEKEEPSDYIQFINSFKKH